MHSQNLTGAAYHIAVIHPFDLHVVNMNNSPVSSSTRNAGNLVRLFATATGRNICGGFVGARGNNTSEGGDRGRKSSLLVLEMH